MNFETMAARVVQLDGQINLFQPHDPAFVERHLIPRRARAWQAFRREWSASCTSADVWGFIHIITKGAP